MKRWVSSVLPDRQRWSYVLRSSLGHLNRGLFLCPCCRVTDYTAVKMKMIVTRLVRCNQCNLLYRVPQDPQGHHVEFYQDDYESTLATNCPEPDQLQRLLSQRFRKTEKNFSRKIDVLRALGVRAGSRCLDFGASWGYGTWQFAQAGYTATGYEISKPRARYASDMLNVDVRDDVGLLDGPFDVFFSSHVLEHLPSPCTAFDLARRLVRPGGLFVAYTPNGSADCMRAHPKLYHESWGRLHPLYYDDLFYRYCFPNNPKLMCSAAYGKQVDLSAISQWDQRSNLTLDVSNRELLVAIVL